jgi:hypothetical protein
LTTGDSLLDDLLEYAEDEYSELQERLRHLDTRVDTARTFGVGVSGAVLTLSVQQSTPLIALGGAALAHGFALIDAYNSFQYRTGADRARRLEEVFDARDRLRRLTVTTPSPSQLTRQKAASQALRKALGRLGKRPYQREVNAPGRREMAYLHPTAVFQRLYPGLVIAGVVLAIVLRLRNDGSSPLATVIFGTALLAVTLPSYIPLERLAFVPNRVQSLASGRSTVISIVFIAAVGITVWMYWTTLWVPRAAHVGTVKFTPPRGATHFRVSFDAAGACSTHTAAISVRWNGGSGSIRMTVPSGWTIRESRSTSSRVSILTATQTGLRHRAMAIVAFPTPDSRLGRCRISFPRATGLPPGSSVELRVRRDGSFVALSGNDALTNDLHPVVVNCDAQDHDCPPSVAIQSSRSLNMRIERLAIALLGTVLAAIAAVGLVLALGRSKPDQRAEGAQAEPNATDQGGPAA